MKVVKPNQFEYRSFLSYCVSLIWVNITGVTIVYTGIFKVKFFWNVKFTMDYFLKVFVWCQTLQILRKKLFGSLYLKATSGKPRICARVVCALTLPSFDTGNKLM